VDAGAAQQVGDHLMQPERVAGDGDGDGVLRQFEPPVASTGTNPSNDDPSAPDVLAPITGRSDTSGSYR
jgi:hypothetical protein